MSKIRNQKLKQNNKSYEKTQDIFYYRLSDRFSKIDVNKRYKLRQSIQDQSAPNIPIINLDMFYQLDDLVLREEIWLYVPERDNIINIFKRTNE